MAALDCGGRARSAGPGLRAKDHPQIRFEVKAYQLGAMQGGRAKLSLDGALTMAGATRPVHLDATASELAGGKLAVTCEHAIDMKDYGVKPPELFFGAMKVDTPGS